MKKHYLLCGIFIGLAHLTHPFGVIIGSSYIVFLLIQKELKGSVIAVGFWYLLLLPWFLRNHYYFGDFGQGFSLPFTDKISNILSFIPTNDQLFLSHSFSEIFYHNDPQLFSPYFSFHRIFDGLSLFSLDIWIIFILIFSIIAFLKLRALKLKPKMVILSLSFIFVIPLLLYFLSPQNDSETSFKVFEIFTITCLPIIGILLLKKELLLENAHSRFSLFVLIFAFLSFLGFYSYTVMDQSFSMDIRILFLSVSLLTPIAIFGFGKFMKLIHQFFHLKHKSIFFICVGILILAPIAFQTSLGLEDLRDNIKAQRMQIDTSIVTKFMRENIPSNDIIGSNHPFMSSMQTGLQTVIIPTKSITDSSFETYIKHYNITHMIFYDSVYTDVLPKVLDIQELNRKPSKYFFEIIPFPNSHLVNVYEIDKATIDNYYMYISKAIYLDQEKEFEKADEIFNELRVHIPSSRQSSLDLCDALVFYAQFYLAIDKCKEIISQEVKSDLVSFSSLNNLAVSYLATNQRDELFNVFSIYDVKFQDEPTNEILFKLWGDMINSLIEMDNYFEIIPTNLMAAAKNYEAQGNYDDAFLIYEKTKYVDGLVLESWKEKIKILTKMGRHEDAVKAYDGAIEVYQNEIKDLQFLGQQNEVLKIQKSMIEAMKGKATLLINLEHFHKAHRVYLELLDIDRFDPDVYKKIAVYHEKYEKLRQAVHNYELALQLEPENDFLIEKIKELKDKIAD